MRVVYSNFQEKLLTELAARIAQSRRPNLRHIVFLPSEALRQYYRENLASFLESTLDIDFYLPSEILDACLELGWWPEQSGSQPLSEDEYKIVLVQQLSHYLHHLQRDPNTESPSEQDKLPEELVHSPLLLELSQNQSAGVFALAQILAGSFHRYSMQATSSQIFDRLCDWQGLLWKQVHERLALRSSYVKIVEELNQLVRKHRLSDIQFYFVSFSRLPKAVLSWVQALAAYHHVEWFFLSPSRLFWAEVSSFLASQHVLAQAAKTYSAPALLQLEEFLLDRNPLLANMAQVAKPLALFLEDQQVTSCDAYILPMDPQNHEAYRELWWQEAPLVSDKSTTLRALQLDLLLMRSPQNNAKVSLNPDLSLVIHQCSDPDLEVKTLKAHILRLLHDDPDLKLSEILIIAPNIRLYRGFIERHFEGSRCELPYCLYDAVSANKQGLFEVLKDLLTFAISPWTPAAYMCLLEKDLISKKFDGKAILRWLKEASQRICIQWGIDRTHRDKLGKRYSILDSDLDTGRSWRNFWNASLLNAFQQPADLLDSMSERVADSFSWHAVDFEPALVFHQTLLKVLAPWYLDQEHDICSWVGFVREAIEQLLDSSMDSIELEKLDSLLHSMQALSFGIKISCQSFTDLLFDGMDGISQSWKGIKDGVLRFASMQPMRSLPAKHICILGLSDDMRQRSRQQPAFEWTNEHGIEPSPSQAGLDRYSFLEAILSARCTLHLFYSNLDPTMTGSPPLPSYLLSELLAYLDQSFEYGSNQRFSQLLHLQHAQSWRDERYSRWPYCDLIAMQNSQLQVMEPAKPISHPPSSVCIELKDNPCEDLVISDVSLLLADPLGFYLKKILKSLSGFSWPKAAEDFQLQVNYDVQKKWNMLAEQQVHINSMEDKLYLQVHSELGAGLYKHMLTEKMQVRNNHWKITSSSLEARLSPGYEVLGLASLSTSESITSRPLKFGDSLATWNLVGSLGLIDPVHPHIILSSSSASKARMDLVQHLPSYIVAYKLGWLEHPRLALYPDKAQSRARYIDLDQLDIDNWLLHLACAAKQVCEQPIAFTKELASFLKAGHADQYVQALRQVALTRSTVAIKRLHLFLDNMGFLNNGLSNSNQAQEWLLLARKYLGPLWQPIFEVYPEATLDEEVGE